MKVAILSSGLVPVPPTMGGAIEEYVFQIATCLRALGIEATVIDRVFPCEYRVPTKEITRLAVPDVACSVPKREILQELVFGLYSSKTLRRYDLVHANTPWAAFSAMNLSVRSKFVYVCHNPLWPSSTIKWSERIVRKIESKVMKRSDAVIALNETMKVALHTKAGLPLDKLCEVPNGVDTTYFIPNIPQESINKKYGLEGSQVILFVGRISRVKGIDVLLKGYKTLLETHRFTRLKLCIVGPLSGRFAKESVGSYAEEIMKWAHQKLPSDSFMFTGAVSKEELRELLSRADLFVLPSFAEAFPLVLLEAMASGCPIIGSRAGGIVNVLQDGVNGYLFKTGSSSDLAEKLVTLLAYPSLRKSMSQSSRKIAEETYDWRVVAGRLLDLYKSVLYG